MRRNAFKGSIRKNKLKRSCLTVIAPIAEFDRETEAKSTVGRTRITACLEWKANYKVNMTLLNTPMLLYTYSLSTERKNKNRSIRVNRQQLLLSAH